MEGFAELVEVLHHSIHAEFAGRVRIHLHHHARVLRAAALAPDLPVLDKELLRRCEAVFFGPVDVFALRGERVLERQERDANAAVVRGVLAQCQLAVHVGTRLGREVVVLVHLAVGPLGEGLAVRRRLPLAQVALAVVLGAFVVEAMRHLVPDDHADAAEVLRRICRQRIERRLQNACGEVDVVHARLVVGVHSGRRHAPLGLVHRLAQLFQVALQLELTAAVHVAQKVAALYREFRVVAPLVRVADLVAVQGQLRLGCLLGLVTHPWQLLDVLAQRLVQRSYQLGHVFFGRGREVFLHPVLSHRFAQVHVREPRAALPARLQLLRALQGRVVEVVVFLDEVVAEPRCCFVNRMPAQVALPRLQALCVDCFVKRLNESRLCHVQRLEGADADLAEVSRPVECGRHLFQLRHGLDVVAIGRFAQIGAAQRALGQRRFDRHHALRFGRRLLRRIAGEHEHLRHVVDVLVTDLRLPLRFLDVVGAIRQPESALPHTGDLLGAVFLVLLHLEVEESVGAVLALELRQNGCQLLLVIQVRDAVQRWLQRRRAFLIHRVHVHARGVEVAVLRLQRRAARTGLGGHFEIFVEQPLIALRQHTEVAPARLVGGDGIVLRPVAAGVLVEVCAGIGAGVHRAEVEHLLRLRLCRCGGAGVGQGIERAKRGGGEVALGAGDTCTHQDNGGKAEWLHGAP